MNNNKVYNQLSEDYNKLFTDNIIQFKKNIFNHGKQKIKYVDFYPSFGIKPKEHCDFLIYGQAMNGWLSEFNFKDDQSTIINTVNRSIEFSNEYFSEGSHCPLDWVNIYWCKSLYEKNVKTQTEKEFYKPMKYEAFRSFFWNVTYKLISKYYDLNPDKWEWSKRMIWSNLYKIAPAKGNPDWFEKDSQKKLSVELVKKEIDEIKPKFCIVLTNEEWWRPFRDKLNSINKLENKSNPEVISFEQYNDTKIILTTRPFRGSSDRHVFQILKLIKPNL